MTLTNYEYLQPSPLTRELGFPFKKLGVKPKYRNKVFKIIKNAIAPNLKFMPTIGWNNVLLIGQQRTGKTNIINFLFDILKKMYPSIEINAPFSNSMEWNLEQLKDVAYNALATDDAVEHQDSYESISKPLRKLSHKFFRIRHLIEERFNRKNHSYVLTVFGFQMFKALMKRMRQADLIFVTSTFSDKEENDFLKTFLSKDHFTYLENKMKYVSLLNDYSFNRYSVLKTIHETYYVDLPIAKSKRRAKQIETDVKPRNLDFEIIEKLENKLSKAEIYEAFAFIYSKERNRNQVKEPEQTYIKKLYECGISMQDLAALFHRHRNTIPKYAKPIAETP